MLLILVLALLFCPSLAEEELRGVKQKKYAYFVLVKARSAMYLLSVEMEMLDLLSWICFGVITSESQICYVFDLFLVNTRMPNHLGSTSV